MAEVSSFVFPFSVNDIRVRGRIVRFDDVINNILSLHAYDESVSLLLARAMIISALIGSLGEEESLVQLQILSDGYIEKILSDYRVNKSIRAMVSYRCDAELPIDNLLGEGVFSLTIDSPAPAGSFSKRYTGYAELRKGEIEESVAEYFTLSEQIPTFVKTAVILQDSSFSKRWFARGFLIQLMPQISQEEEKKASECWNDAYFRAKSLTNEELLDKNLSEEHLLYRLFPEYNVCGYPREIIRSECTCSREKIEKFLEKMSYSEKKELCQEESVIRVTCDFCSTSYDFFVNEE